MALLSLFEWKLHGSFASAVLECHLFNDAYIITFDTLSFIVPSMCTGFKGLPQINKITNRIKICDFCSLIMISHIILFRICRKIWMKNSFLVKLYLPLGYYRVQVEYIFNDIHFLRFFFFFFKAIIMAFLNCISFNSDIPHYFCTNHHVGRGIETRWGLWIEFQISQVMSIPALAQLMNYLGEQDITSIRGK